MQPSYLAPRSLRGSPRCSRCASRAAGCLRGREGTSSSQVEEGVSSQTSHCKGGAHACNSELSIMCACSVLYIRDLSAHSPDGGRLTSSWISRPTRAMTCGERFSYDDVLTKLGLSSLIVPSLAGPRAPLSRSRLLCLQPWVPAEADKQPARVSLAIQQAVLDGLSWPLSLRCLSKPPHV